MPGRPYDVYVGDQVQIRRTIPRVDGQLRNGTTATIAGIDEHWRLRLELIDGQTRELDREELADADLRLAYVQHPFPAQGATVDTAHLIAGDHPTRHGTYVAITRAREGTDIHAGRNTLAGTENTQQEKRPVLEQLADKLSRDEPETPSIRIPVRQPQRERDTLGAVIDDGYGYEL